MNEYDYVASINFIKRQGKKLEYHKSAVERMDAETSGMLRTLPRMIKRAYHALWADYHEDSIVEFAQALVRSEGLSDYTEKK